MDLTLSDDERAFRLEVREFIAGNLTDDLRRAQKLTTGVYPHPGVSTPWHRSLAERGWIAPLWPEEYGGAGWTPIQRFIFEAECALAGAPVLHPMGIRLLGPVLIRFGTPAQKAHYLPRILQAQDYWCQGFSEPNAGSDLTSLRTTAKLDGDHFVVDGGKIWTTQAHFANMMFLLVRTSSEGKPREGLSFLLLKLDTPGVSIRPIISMDGSHELNQVFFDSVRVPRANLVGEENGGWACAQHLLEFERGAGLFSSRLRAQLKRLRDVIDEIAAEGHDILADPQNAARFAEVAIELDTFEMLELRTLGNLDAGGRLGAMSSMLKLRASRMRQTVTTLGVGLMGSYATRFEPIREGDNDPATELVRTLAPDYLNSRAYTIFGGASEVQLGLIARTLGL